MTIAAAALFVSPRAARADGAFPDSLGIIAPADRPHDIVVATTFGVVSSIDDGQTWTWSCEQDKNSFGAQYQMSAPPLDRIYTRSQAAGWCSPTTAPAAGAWPAARSPAPAITDAFPDPTNANRVLVVAMATDADGGDRLPGLRIVGRRRDVRDPALHRRERRTSSPGSRSRARRRRRSTSR